MMLRRRFIPIFCNRQQCDKKSPPIENEKAVKLLPKFEALPVLFLHRRKLHERHSIISKGGGTTEDNAVRQKVILNHLVQKVCNVTVPPLAHGDEQANVREMASQQSGS